ncbi:MAG: hypothetical protein G01um101466_229 [Parcubacteria group bacterium Gr01-1014_66]|nr:MAG: hypothetical protein G01um101466_229 [Parcubacteria group bacterium Gr01-1014_66]
MFISGSPLGNVEYIGLMPNEPLMFFLNCAWMTHDAIGIVISFGMAGHYTQIEFFDAKMPDFKPFPMEVMKKYIEENSMLRSLLEMFLIARNAGLFSYDELETIFCGCAEIIGQKSILRIIRNQNSTVSFVLRVAEDYEAAINTEFVFLRDLFIEA